MTTIPSDNEPPATRLNGASALTDYAAFLRGLLDVEDIRYARSLMFSGLVL